MKKLFFLSVVLFALCGSVKAETFAEKMTNYDTSHDIVRGQNCCHPFYIAISGGWSFLGDQDIVGPTGYDSGMNVNLALGWQERCGRIELEYSNFNNGFEDEDAGFASVQAWLVSGYYDMSLTDHITAYGGAGVGAGRQTTNIAFDLTSDLAFVYQARAGLSASVTDRVEVFSGYRFLASTEADSVVGNSESISINGWEGGLRFKF